MMSKRRSSGMTCSQRLRNYASKLLIAMSMIVAMEERKERELSHLRTLKVLYISDAYLCFLI